MTFAIRGLDPAPFRPLFEMSDAQLAARNALRRFADDCPGFPCRVSLEDADLGEEVVLLHFAHHPVDTPYRESGPIYVRRSARRFSAVDTVPPALVRRLLSVRGYDAAGLMKFGDVVEGVALGERIGRAFEEAGLSYLQVHYARTGCFACRVERAG